MLTSQVCKDFWEEFKGVAQLCSIAEDLAFSFDVTQVSCCQLLFIGLPTMDLAPTNSLQDWVGDASSHLVDGMQPLQDAGLSDCDGRTAVIADQLPGRLPPICWHFLRGTCTRGRWNEREWNTLQSRNVAVCVWHFDIVVSI